MAPRRRHLPKPAEPEPHIDPVALVDRVEEIRVRLHDATHKMNQVLLRAEIMFIDLGFKKEASIPLLCDDEPRCRQPRDSREQRLVWQVFEGRWRMVLEVRRPAKGGGTFTTSNPLISASRQTRMAALRSIEKFHDALVTAASVSGR